MLTKLTSLAALNLLVLGCGGNDAASAMEECGSAELWLLADNRCTQAVQVGWCIEEVRWGQSVECVASGEGEVFLGLVPHGARLTGLARDWRRGDRLLPEDAATCATYANLTECSPRTILR